jgi:hypothetical protein
MELPVEKSRVTLEWSPWSGLGQDEVSPDIESVMIKESKSGVNTKTGSAATGRMNRLSIGMVRGCLTVVDGWRFAA